MKRKIIIEIISILLVSLFVYAAISKLIEYQKFKIQVSKSPLLTSFSSLVVIGIPLVELLLSVLLVIKSTRLLALYGSLALMTLFTGYLIGILNFSYYIPCSCGGILQGMSWKTHIAFNSFFVCITLAAILMYPLPERKQIQDISRRFLLANKAGEAENL